MAYHIYTTEAFILGAQERGEADKLITIFTRDLGLVRAVAKGVRHAKSKLAPHLLNFSCSKVSMVRGKEVWRLTGAQPHRLSIKEAELFSTYTRVLTLVRRFVHWESADPQLFDCIKECFLEAKKSISIRESHESAEVEPSPLFIFDHTLFEALVIMKIMHILGYVAHTPDLERFLANGPVTSAVLSEASPYAPVIIQTVNHALKVSHL